MACKPCKKPRVTPRRLVPTWADPALMLTGNAWRFTTVNTSPGTPTNVAPANPLRWALGFMPGSAKYLTLRFFPQGTNQALSFLADQSTQVLWLTSFQYGPIVQAAWQTLDVGVSPVGVYEIYLLPDR